MSKDEKLSKVCSTITEMMSDRNYLDQHTPKQILETFKKDQHVLYQISDNTPIVIVYLNQNNVDGNVGKNDIKKLMDEIMVPNNFVHAIIIIDSVSLTPSAKTEISNYFPDIIFETFTIAELVFNITKHEKVPKHILLSEEETGKVLEKFKSTKEQMPVILFEDKIARYLGMLPGKMCKIERKSETAGITEYYRVCAKI
jgi:DNA-directed RNA polymerase I, II, and III subunit RPABC1